MDPSREKKVLHEKKILSKIFPKHNSRKRKNAPIWGENTGETTVFQGVSALEQPLRL
jgi:hypothetical protein